MIMKSYQQHQHHNPRCYISLACSIGSIGVACGSLLQLTSTSDRISLQRGLFLTSMGFVYFISLTDFFNKYFLETRQGIRFRKKYHLMVSDVMDITNKIVSAIQAAFSCIAGFIVCKSSCTKSFLFASHYVMEAYAWFGTAYFMYDIYSMYKVHTQKIADKLKLMNITTAKSLSSPSSLEAEDSSSSGGGGDGSTNNGRFCDKKGNIVADNKEDENATIIPDDHDDHVTKKHFDDEDEMDYDEIFEIPKDGRWDFLKYILTHPVMIIHHVFIGTFGLLVVTYLNKGFGDCVYSFIYLMEFSTPFVSLRSVLSTLGLKNTRLYIVNGLLMLGTFFICRILMWPYVLHWYSIAIDRPFIQSIMGLPRGCKISILILFLPQIYWFSLMVKGAVKVFLIPKQNVVNKKADENIIIEPKQKSYTTTTMPTNQQQYKNGRPVNLIDTTNQKFPSSSLQVVQNQKPADGKSPNQSRTLL